MQLFTEEVQLHVKSACEDELMSATVFLEELAAVTVSQRHHMFGHQRAV